MKKFIKNIKKYLQKLQKIIIKNKEFIKYGICGVITVIINLLLYKLFLNIHIYYIISSLVSYFIAALISYYLNVYVVFQKKILPLKEELKRILEYFSVRILSVIVDTLLLIFMVEIVNFDEFYSKPLISVIVIILTFILNRKIFKKGDKNERVS